MSCSCNVTLSNTGTSGCSTAMAVTKKLILMSAINAAGNDAFASIANIKSFSAVEPWLNVGTAALSRWLPLPSSNDLENIVTVREEPVMQTFNSGKMAKVRDGFRSFEGFIPNGDTQLLERLVAFGCASIGAFLVDQDDNVIGSKRSQTTIPYTNLYPILIDKDTWDVQFVAATDSEVQMIKIKFQWSSTEQDADLRMVPNSEMDWGRDEIYGLIDVYGTEISCGQTTTVVDIFAANGTTETEPITGLLVANFAGYNVTGSASVTVTVATESVTVPGRYTLTYASQTVSDELQFSIAKDRYDSEIGLEKVVFTVV